MLKATIPFCAASNMWVKGKPRGWSTTESVGNNWTVHLCFLSQRKLICIYLTACVGTFLCDITAFPDRRKKKEGRVLGSVFDTNTYICKSLLTLYKQKESAILQDHWSVAWCWFCVLRFKAALSTICCHSLNDHKRLHEGKMWTCWSEARPPRHVIHPLTKSFITYRRY